MGYIYKIINDINDKIYIGQTIRTIEERWKEHLKESNRIRADHPIYRAMRKYGNEHFSIMLIEEIPNDKLDEREKYWIKQYNTYSNGYNATYGGNGYRNDYTEVYQLWLQGYLIKDIAEKTHHKRDLISSVLKREYNVTQEEIYSRAYKCENNKTENPHNKGDRGYCHPRRVYQIDNSTNQIIATFNTIVDAALSLNRDNMHSTTVCISNVCRGKKKTAYGYKWAYVDNMDDS